VDGVTAQADRCSGYESWHADIGGSGINGVADVDVDVEVELRRVQPGARTDSDAGIFVFLPDDFAADGVDGELQAVVERDPEYVAYQLWA